MIVAIPPGPMIHPFTHLISYRMSLPDLPVMASPTHGSTHATEECKDYAYKYEQDTEGFENSNANKETK